MFLNFFLRVCVFSEVVFETLVDNIENYKRIHFQWNRQNLDPEKFKSLWALEAELEPDTNMDEVKYNGKVRFSLEKKSDDEEGGLPCTMRYSDKNATPDIHVRSEAGGLPRTMMYSDKRPDDIRVRSEAGELPRTMMYSGKRPDDIRVRSEAGGLPRTMMYSGKRPDDIRVWSEAGGLPRTMMYSGKRPDDIHVIPRSEDVALPRTMRYSGCVHSAGCTGEIKYSQTEANERYSVQRHRTNTAEVPLPRTMRYSGKKAPLSSFSENIFMNALENQYSQPMMYSDKKQQVPSVPDENILVGRAQDESEDIYPRTMMYNGPIELIRPYENPQMMMYSGKKQTLPSVPDERILIKRAQDDSEDKYPRTMMYNSAPIELARPYENPQVMMYSDKKQPIPSVPDERILIKRAQDESEDIFPRTMMYNSRPIELARPYENPQMMMYSDKKQPIPSVPDERILIKRAQDESEDIYPRTMMYNSRPIELARPYENPQMMMYSDKQPVPSVPEERVLIKRVQDEPEAQAMMNIDPEPGIDPHVSKRISSKRLNKLREGSHPQPMLFSGNSQESSKKALHVVTLKHATSDRKSQKISSDYFTLKNVTQYKYLLRDNVEGKTQWFKITNSLIKLIPNDTSDYFHHWKNIISVFSDETLSRKKYAQMFPSLCVHDAIKNVGNTDIYLKLFWPFILENAVMIQKLALLGLSGKIVPIEKQKLAFFHELEKYQTIKIPVAQDKIILSFNHPELVEGLKRAGLLEISKDYVDAGLHLYTPEEQSVIENKVYAAMDLINKTSPELYLAITQLIGSIAFYKAEQPGYAGGSISSALGVIWEDPRAYKEFSVPHYAEQIVHEFIHNTLFLVDMVKELFVDHRKFLKAKVWSPIRHQLRSYDRTFHACYVSTGNQTFLSLMVQVYSIC